MIATSLRVGSSCRIPRGEGESGEEGGEPMNRRMAPEEKSSTVEVRMRPSNRSVTFLLLSVKLLAELPVVDGQRVVQMETFAQEHLTTHSLPSPSRSLMLRMDLGDRSSSVTDDGVVEVWRSGRGINKRSPLRRS